VTGDDHNTDALIAALRSPALPAERAGEAAAVTAMLGVLARTPASPRFRAGRGIAIAVVTVASLGVGGLAAAGPGVFQAAANKARSLVTPDSGESSADAGRANSGDPHRGSLPDETNGSVSSAAALALAAQLSATTDDCSATPCGASAGLATPLISTAPPPKCADGTHGDAVAAVANSSVPPNTEQNHDQAVTPVAHDACTPDGPQGNGVPGGTNPNKPPDKPADTPQGPPSSTPNGNGNPGGNSTPNTGPPVNVPPVNAPPVKVPPVTTPPHPPVGPPDSTPGSDNGHGGGSGQGRGPGADNGQNLSSKPLASVPPDNGNANGKGNGG
jgi:hypothetical protein